MFSYIKMQLTNDGNLIAFLDEYYSDFSGKKGI